MEMFTLLCGTFMQNTVYEILWEWAEFCRRYDETFWLTIFWDTVYIGNTIRHETAYIDKVTSDT